LEFCEKVFQVDNVLLGSIPVGDNQYRFDHNVLENVFKRVVRKQLGSENSIMSDSFDSASNGCPVFVVATNAASGRPVVFRSYGGMGFKPSEAAIWQAARATSATPLVFKEIYIDKPQPGVTYVGGGLGYNNPSEIALDEAHRLWPMINQFCLVSIGTGNSKLSIFIDSRDGADEPDKQNSLINRITKFIPRMTSVIPGWKSANDFPAGVVAMTKMASLLASLATDTRQVHERLLRSSYDLEHRFPYFRFDVGRDIGDIGLEEWHKTEEIAAHTISYMQETETGRRRSKCVEYLIHPPKAVLKRKQPLSGRLIVNRKKHRPEEFHGSI
jgi:predicted acylesterase/phospholipase RssA